MKNMPTLPKSMEIQTGDIAAVQMATSWNVALVLSIYRIYKKGSGAQLFASELAKGCLHSARIVIMQEVHNEQSSDVCGVFKCDANSLCLVVPADKVGIKLESSSSRKDTGIDGQKIVLGEDRGLRGCFSKVFFHKQTA